MLTQLPFDVYSIPTNDREGPDGLFFWLLKGLFHQNLILL